MDSMNMDRVRRILQQHFPKTEWNISLPDDGQLRASYIAQSKEQRVFIKFDVPIDAFKGSMKTRLGCATCFSKRHT